MLISNAGNVIHITWENLGITDAELGHHWIIESGI